MDYFSIILYTWRQDIEDEVEELDEEWVELVKSYTDDNGKANQALQLIDCQSKYDIPSLRHLMDSYRPLNKSEKQVLRCIRQGLKLLETGKKLLHNTNFPVDGVDGHVTRAADQFMIVYDTNDLLMEYLIHDISTCAMDGGYEFFSSINKTVTPKTKALAKPDRFVSDFFNWIENFSDAIYNR